MKEILKLIGERVRELRNKKGINQEELAHQAKLHYTYIGKVERGEKNLSLESLINVTKALDVSLEEFFSTIDPNMEGLNSYLINIA